MRFSQHNFPVKCTVFTETRYLLLSRESSCNIVDLDILLSYERLTIPRYFRPSIYLIVFSCFFLKRVSRPPHYGILNIKSLKYETSQYYIIQIIYKIIKYISSTAFYKVTRGNFYEIIFFSLFLLTHINFLFIFFEKYRRHAALLDSSRYLE